MTPSSNSHSPRKTLAQWLSYLETIHSTEIDLGLQRINQVAQQLKINFSFAKVITVAGTNGKGTTCAFLENALMAEGKSVAVYSSPHIEHFNERLRINKCDVSDAPLISAFELIEQTRGDISLTYYEYTTLAAFIVLMQTTPDVIILEVGLGGRLDATNIIDANIAVITTIDLDHQAFLGDTRELIGKEKAGIMRSGKLAVLGDTRPTVSIISHANDIGSSLKVREQDFTVRDDKASWLWSYENFTLTNLSITKIPQDNVATALMVLHLLKVELTSDKINKLIHETKVAGRTELIEAQPNILLDVAHNPQAGRYLASYLAKVSKGKKYQKITAVVGMLADKDIVNTLQPMQQLIDHWYVGNADAPRAATAEFIAETLTKTLATDANLINCFDNITQAFKMACHESDENDLVVAFGSFYTVAEIRRLLIS